VTSACWLLAPGRIRNPALKWTPQRRTAVICADNGPAMTAYGESHGVRICRGKRFRDGKDQAQ
jgi:hypothetical protein